MTLKLLELFGGIGSPRKALVNLGVDHKSIDYVEIDDKAVKTYNAIFNSDYEAKSVEGYSLEVDEPLDVLVHGSPCQDFSIAGKQLGGNAEDGTRSSLLFETIEVVKNLGGNKPKIVIWENVKNVLSKKMKPAFDKYLQEMEQLGYSNAYEVLNAKDFGIPQARERIFVVSVLGDNQFIFDNLEKKKMKDINLFLENEVNDRYTITQPSMLAKINATGTRTLKPVKDYVWTITTKQLRCPNSGIVSIGNGQYRLLTERECWRLMGFSDEDFDNAEKAHPRRQNYLNGTLYHQSGNSIVVDVLEAIFKELLKIGQEELK